MGGGETKPENVLFLVPSVPPDLPGIIDKLREKYPRIKFTLHSPPNPDRLPPKELVKTLPAGIFRDATILVTQGGASLLPADPAHDAPNLHLLHLSSAGVNGIFGTPLYEDTDITVTTSSGIHGPQIAEWVIMTMLMHSHHAKVLLDSQRRREWYRGLPPMVDKAGLRVGVLGYGSIGRQVAHVARAMGMEVYAYTASPRSTPASRRDDGYIVPGTGDPDGSIPTLWFSGTSKADLHTFLGAEIDVLVISLPLTPATTHLIGAPELAILGRRRAFLSNISRGAIIDQPALIASLKRGLASAPRLHAGGDAYTARVEAAADSEVDRGLSGAALDVTDPEPLPEDSELWGLENAIVTPHVSGSSTAYTERSIGVLDLNLTRLEKGEKLVNVVDRKKGY